MIEVLLHHRLKPTDVVRRGRYLSRLTAHMAEKKSTILMVNSFVSLCARIVTKFTTVPTSFLAYSSTSGSMMGCQTPGKKLIMIAMA